MKTEGCQIKDKRKEISSTDGGDEEGSKKEIRLQSHRKHGVSRKLKKVLGGALCHSVYGMYA